MVSSLTFFIQIVHSILSEFLYVGNFILNFLFSKVFPASFFTQIQSSGAGVFFVILFLLFFFIVAGFVVKRLWDYLLQKAIEKRLQMIRKAKQFHALPEENSQDDDFFTSDTMSFLKRRHESWSAQKVLTANFDKPTEIESFSGNKYREFAQMLPDIVYECDLDGNILFLNNAGIDILKRSAPDIDLQKINVYDFLDPEEQEMAKNSFKLIEEDRNAYEAAYTIRIEDQVFMNVLTYSLPVMKKDRVIGVRGLIVDITQRKKNEETIKTLKDIVSHVDLGINVFKQESEAGKVFYRLEMVNHASSRFLTSFNNSNVGKTLNELSPETLHSQLSHLFQKSITSGEPQELDEFVSQPDPSRHEQYLNVKIFPLPQSRVVLLIEEVSQKRKAEQYARMASLGIENAGDLIFWVDNQGSFLFANGTACQKYGYLKDELLKMAVTDVDTRISSMQWYELIQILETKQSLTIESIHKTRDGDAFPVEISINKFIFGGKNNYLAFVRDISDRKRSDELEQKIQVARKSAALKQQFLANMSHEIRTPMTGIMGMTSLLMRTNLSPAQQEYVRNIKISSENLLNIINDVLDLSKIEAGKMELKPNRISLREFVGEIREIFNHQAQSKGIRFSTAIDPGIPQFIVVDDQRLKQIVNNLLSNAFKFTDDGQVSIKFAVKNKTEKHVAIICHVKDTGMGISKENQKQVFEKFTQIESSLIRPFEGTGLGLAICRELTQLLGGEISVESEPEVGSTFTFTFLAEYDKKDGALPSEDHTRDYKELKINVLHVEDKLLNQKVVGFILFNAGCNVDFVKNGKEALEYYKPGKYDIILMDIQMPVMDGITAYKELKRLHGDKLCPVIGLSANALEGDAQKYMAVGLDDYLIKPFQPSALYDKILKWAGNKNKS
jgi:PAS domain S-box-containing protein